jgi:hypothetical protein
MLNIYNMEDPEYAAPALENLSMGTNEERKLLDVLCNN